MPALRYAASAHNRSPLPPRGFAAFPPGLVPLRFAFLGERPTDADAHADAYDPADGRQARDVKRRDPRVDATDADLSRLPGGYAERQEESEDGAEESPGKEAGADQRSEPAEHVAIAKKFG